MKASEAIRAILKEKGMNQTVLAQLVGMNSQRNVSDALLRDIKVRIVAQFAEALGYEVVVRKKTPGKKKQGEFVLSYPLNNEE